MTNDLSTHLEARRQKTSPETELVAQGVSTEWLAKVFKVSRDTVERRLMRCPPLYRKMRGTKMESVRYDIATAAAYIVQPVFSTLDYLRALKKNQLPPALQQSLWDALLKRQKWEEQAGLLWRTDKVRDALGSTFQTIKFTMQLWVDTVERQTELSDDQRKVIIASVDALQNDLYDALVKNLGGQLTGPQLDELGDLVGEDMTMAEIIAVADDPDDISDLV